MSKAVRNDAAVFEIVCDAHHRVGLTAAGLSICKNGSVVAFEDAFNKPKGTLVVHCRLFRVGVEDLVVSKLLLDLLSIQFRSNFNRSSGLVCAYNTLAV